MYIMRKRRSVQVPRELSFLKAIRLGTYNQHQCRTFFALGLNIHLEQLELILFTHGSLRLVIRREK